MNFNYAIKTESTYRMTGDNTLAEVTFPSISDDTVNINHTFVDHSLRGQA